MEFVAKKSDLLRELISVQNVVERKTTIPILSNFLFTAKNGTLTISATDLDQSMRTSCSAAIVSEGSTTVPARKFMEYLKLLAEGDVHMKVGENHWLHIKAGRAKTKMVGMAPSNFPVLPEPPATRIKLPIIAMTTLIEKTMFAISNEESRYTLNGALFVYGPDKLEFVTTDGHRLANVTIDKKVEGVDEKVEILLPRKALATLLPILKTYEDGMFEFGFDDNTLFFTVANRVITSRKLTGKFPNYQAVLPKDNNIIVTVNSRQLRDALGRVGQFTDGRANSVKMVISGSELKLSASNTELGESEDALDMEESVKETVTAGFNVQYVTDILKSYPEVARIQISLKGSDKAAEFIPVGDGTDPSVHNRQVVMPVRVS